MKRVLHLLLRLLPRVTTPVLVLVPLFFLAMQGFNGLLRVADGLLAQLRPVVEAEISSYLQRPVHIGKLTPNLTVRKLNDIILHPDTYGSLPVEISNITVENRDGEIPLAGGRRELATAQRVTLFVALPNALSGNIGTAIPRIQVEGPDLVLIRDKTNHFNVLNILPPHKQTDKPQPTFRTVVEIDDARVHFRDYSAVWKGSAEPDVAINDVTSAHTVVDLSGTRAIQLTVGLRATPGTLTAERLRGALTVNGTIRREEPGKSPGGPRPGTPILSMQFAARDADLPYWLNYIFTGKVPIVALQKGRGDADITLMLPDRFPDKDEPLSLSLNAAFRDVDTTLLDQPLLLKGANGTLELTDGLLRFSVRAKALDEEATATGAVWNLPQLAASPPTTPIYPSFSVAVNMPRLPVARAVQVFQNDTFRLPAQLTVGGTPAVEATLTGTTGNIKEITVVGRVAGANGVWKGLPGLQNATADVMLAGGVLQLTGASASLVGGGRVTGEGTVRLIGEGGTVGNAAFSARIDDIDLARLELLQALNASNSQMHLRGLGSVQAVGRRIDGKLTAAANVTTKGLSLGQVAVPVARARVLVEDNRVVVPAARFESLAGVANVTGQVQYPDRLALRFTTASLDLQALGKALGYADASGIVSAQGTVSGTVKKPLVTIAELQGMNLRVRTPIDEETTRQFSLDLVRGQNIELTPQRLHLTRPLLAFRFPARIEVTGDVADLTPAPKQRFNPRFDLTARVENVSYEEVQRQLAVRERNDDQTIRRLPRTPATDQPVSGSVSVAAVRLRGTLADPRITGQAKLGTIVVGTYPLRNGSLAFDYNKQRTQVLNAAITGSIGIVRANVTIGANNSLSGTFSAADLNVGKLAYLTKGLLQFDGLVSINGRVGGTVERPTATADLSAPVVTVAGTNYYGLTAQSIRFVGGEKGRGGVLEIPSLTFDRRRTTEPGPLDTHVALTAGRYNLKTGEVGLDMTVRNGDLSTLIETVRRSGMDETEWGAGIVRALNGLPNPTDAAFDIRQLAVRGQIVDGKFEHPQADVDIAANRILFGEYASDDPNDPTTLALKGTLREKVINVTQFEVKRKAATIRGAGVYDPDGQVNGYLESNGASLDIVRSLPGQTSFPLFGAVDFSVYARGSSKNPTVTASLQGNDLFYVLSDKPGVSYRKRVDGDKTHYGVDLSLFRVEADMNQTNPGQYNINVSDLLVRGAGSVELSGDALIPVSTSTEQQSVASRPLSFHLRTSKIDLKQVIDYLQAREATPEAAPKRAAKGIAGVFNTLKEKITGLFKVKDETIKDNTPLDVGGTVAANIAYEGSLANPTLSGTIAIENGHLRLPRNGPTDSVSPITDFQANLRLAGSSILFDQFSVKLGGINKERGSYGTLNISGGIELRSLAELERLLRRQSEARRRPEDRSSLGAYRLALTFDKFRPAIDNLLGFGEGAKAQVDGTLQITGDLLTPTIATGTNAPLKISRADIRVPTIQKKTDQAVRPSDFNPNFAVTVSLTDTLAINSPGTFRFDVKSLQDIAIRGRLFTSPGDTTNGLNVIATMTPQGGFFQLPTARFTVQRQGEIALRYGVPDAGVRATEVQAKATVSTQRGLSLGSFANSSILTSNSDPTTPVSRYDITLTLDGPLIAFDDTTSQRNTDNQTSVIKELSSDPPLPQQDILALLGGKNAFDLAQQGQIQTAVRDIANQALYSTYLPGLVSQVTGGVAQTLGLQDLTIDYNSGNPRVRVVKRLAQPLDRFIVDYSRTFQQRNAPGTLTPFTFTFSYELYQFRTNNRYLPRLQLGYRTDELHNDRYFLSGTVTY